MGSTLLMIFAHKIGKEKKRSRVCQGQKMAESIEFKSGGGTTKFYTMKFKLKLIELDIHLVK